MTIGISLTGDKGTFSKFADGTELGGMAARPDGHASLQMDLDRLESWSVRTSQNSTNVKYKILSLGRNYTTLQYALWADNQKSSLAEKNQCPGRHKVEHKSVMCPRREEG